MDKHTTPEGRRREWAESVGCGLPVLAERARAAALAGPSWPPPMRKMEIADSL